MKASCYSRPSSALGTNRIVAFRSAKEHTFAERKATLKLPMRSIDVVDLVKDPANHSPVSYTHLTLPTKA